VGVKVYPHRLRHTAATQLLNAGCRITSIQRFLGHKKLNTTMIYARVLDQTVAEDYFKAMVQVEKQLTMPEGLLAQPVPVGEMLKMVDLLVGSILEPAQSEIIQTLRSGLSFLAERDAFVMNIKELADV
jgi:hypothetical protein